MNVPYERHGTSRREFLIFYYKYRLRLLVAFLLPFCLAVAISFIPTPRYKAESVLIVRLGSEYVYKPEVGGSQGGGDTTLPFENEQIFKSEVAILSSEDLHRQVLKSIGVDTLFPELSHPVGFSLFVRQLQGAINDKLKMIGLVHDEPPLPPEQQEQLHIAHALQLFDRRFDIMLARESAVISVSFEHKDPAMAVKVLDTLLTLYYEKRKQIYLDPRAELAQTEMDATRQHALAAQQAIGNYKLKHKIYSLDDQRRQLLAARDEAQRQALSINNPQLEGKIAAYTRQLNELDAAEHEYSSLQKEADIANESYSLYSHRLDEAKAYEDLQRERIGSVRIIQPPSASAEPKKLQPIIILAGAFVAFVFALVVAAITEFSRRGFVAPEQIERSLALPVLAVIPIHKRP